MRLGLFLPGPESPAMHVSALLLPTRHKARCTPNLWSCKSLKVQEATARNQNVEVEEVERVESVEAAGEGLR
jgi:hypothetical protein